MLQFLPHFGIYFVLQNDFIFMSWEMLNYANYSAKM